jgi:hypothetical protein
LFYFAGVDVLVVRSGKELDLLFPETNYVPQMVHWGNAVDAALERVYREWLEDLKAELTA